MRDRVATNTTVTPSATQFLDRLLTAVVKDFRSLDADYRQATGGQKPTAQDFTWELQKTLVRELRTEAGV